jgi:hypothetical protein
MRPEADRFNSGNIAWVTIDWWRTWKRDSGPQENGILTAKAKVECLYPKTLGQVLKQTDGDWILWLPLLEVPSINTTFLHRLCGGCGQSTPAPERRCRDLFGTAQVLKQDDSAQNALRSANEAGESPTQ